MSTAVLVVDFQADFTEYKNGSLAINGTDEIYIRKLSLATRRYKEVGYKIYATKDLHPFNHSSFGNPWPVHCVKDTPGSKILISNNIFDRIFSKGYRKNFDSYSGFADEGGEETDLDETLTHHNINSLIIYGIATDYCVKATVLDALIRGYDVYVKEHLCRGTNSISTSAAIEEMSKRGAHI